MNILKFCDNSKTIQIIIDKLIVGLIIILVTFGINRTIEKIKIQNSIAQVSISKFIDTCNTTWNMINIAEKDSSDLASSAFIFRLKEKNSDKSTFLYESEFSEQFKSIEKEKEEIKNYINENEFILGSDLSLYFYKYLSFLEMYTDSSIDFNLCDSEKRTESYDKAKKTASEEMRKLRFDLLASQKFAIEKFLK